MMKDTIHFKVFSYFALFFAIMNLLLSNFAEVSFNGLVFAWVVVINIGLRFLKSEKLRYVAAASILLPILWSPSITQLIFYGMMVLLSVLFLLLDIARKDYFAALSQFRHEIVILLGVAFMAVVTRRGAVIWNLIALYTMVYLLSSVLLLRTLRVMEHAKDLTMIRKMNIRYTVGMLVASVGLSIESVRTAILSVFDFFYSGIATVVVYLVQFIFIMLYKIVKLVVMILSSSSSGVEDKGNDKLKTDILKELAKKSHYVENSNPLVFNIIVGVLITLFIAFIFYLVYRKQNRMHREYTSFSEEKEHIERTKEENKGLFRRLTQLVKPKTNNEKIRFYYTKYLRLCKQSKIDIQKSDSSLDVNQKAIQVFDRGLTYAMRAVYIRARYSKEQVDDQSCKEFIHHYGKLKKPSLSERFGKKSK